MTFRGFIESSLVEWDGYVSAVLFVQGCNWRCAYCHGWRFVIEPEELDEVDAEFAIDRISEWSDWIDAVVVSGGEPTLYSDLPQFLERVRSIGMMIKLETNGSNPNMLEDIVERDLVDCLSIDCKSALSKMSTVARSNVVSDDVLRSYNINVDREFHTTLCPTHISLEEIPLIACQLPSGQKWVLQQYRPDDVMDIQVAGTDTFSSNMLDNIASCARAHYDGEVLLIR